MEPDKNKRKVKQKKKLENLLRRSVFLVFFVLFAYLIISTGPGEFSFESITGYVTFDSNPSITGAQLRTDDNLTCSWSNSDDTNAVNATWLNDSVIFSNSYDATGNLTQITLSSVNTLKDQNWTCKITLFNETDNITTEDTETIQNTGPDTPKIYDQDVNQELTISILEDSTYNLVFNATDMDNDELTYAISLPENQTLCTILDSDTGEIECIGTNADHLIVAGNGSETQADIELRLYATETAQGGGYASYKDATFTILPVNDAPELTPLSNEQINDNTTYSSYIVATDEENNPLNYTISYTDCFGLVINYSTGELTFNTSDGKPGLSSEGNYTINITVFDFSNHSLNDSAGFELEILSTNYPPVINRTTYTQNLFQGDSFYALIELYDLNTNQTQTFSTDNPLLYTTLTLANTTINDITYWNASVNITTITNDHVTDREFIFYVNDSLGGEDSILIEANFTNVNDAPEIHDHSNYDENIIPSISDINLSNLSAYTNVYFQYKINTSDVDFSTYEGELLSYSLNDSRFNITNEGIFNFIISDIGMVSNYSVLINVSDDGNASGVNLSVTKILNLELLNNSIPYFTDFPISLNCSELSECYYDINASDVNIISGDSVFYYLEDITITESEDTLSDININESTGIINFTPSQNEIGIYNITIKINDSRGSYNFSSFILSINNTNNAPTLDPVVIPGYIVMNKTFNYDIVNANDDDLNLTLSPYENLSFDFELTPAYLGLFNLTKTGPDTARITLFTWGHPNAETNYNVTINVTDSTGLTNEINTNFTIVQKGVPPVINEIYPYGNSSNDYEILRDWRDTSFYPNAITALKEYENKTVIFNHSTTDVNADISSYEWTLDGIAITDSRLIENNHTLEIEFDFFDAGIHEVILFVEDEKYNVANWTWNVSIENFNRPPIFINDLMNFTGANSISGTVKVIDYFTITEDNLPAFYDPDFDFNENGRITGDETSNLTYLLFRGNCTDTAAIEIGGHDNLQISGLAVGTCHALFSGTDADGELVQSNEITINITEPVEIIEEQESSSSSSSSRLIPIPLEQDSPEPLNIITAKSVVIYQDSTMVIPIELKNNWSSRLQELSIEVESDEEDFNYTLSNNYFDELNIGDTKFLDLTIYNYREPGSYEIEIIVEVDNPIFTDTAVVIVNSLEETHKGETLETKLSFAKDFLSSNKECQELQEILNQAENSLAEGNQESAEAYLNVAINGCKYMMESQISSEEYHKSGVISLVLDHDFLKDIVNNKNTLLIIGIILVVILIIVTILIKKLRLKKKKFTQDIVDANKEKNNSGASDSTESENTSKQPIGGYDRV